MQEQPAFIITSTLSQLDQTARGLINYAQGCPTWLFIGDLGLGKTTLIKAICRQLQVTTSVTSPTFSLVNTYYLPSGKSIYHMDAYRIRSEQDMVEMDYPFYFGTGVYCFIEWPQNIQSILPTPHLSISLLPGKSPYSRQVSARLCMLPDPLPIKL